MPTNSDWSEAQVPIKAEESKKINQNRRGLKAKIRFFNFFLLLLLQ